MIPSGPIGKVIFVSRTGETDVKCVNPISGSDFESTDQRTQQDAMFWASCVSEPWSVVSYRIHINHHFQSDTPESHRWLAECDIPVCDGIAANIFAYGEDEEDALRNVKALMAKVIGKYAPKDEKEDTQ